MHTRITLGVFALFLISYCPLLLAQSPVPYVHNPVVPAAATPGGPAFTLTVNGAGFVSGDVVKWNGSARVTTFVSNTRLTAQITGADIAVAETAYITVVNPSGGISNSAFFQVTTPTTSLAFTRTDTDFSNGGGQIDSFIAQPMAITRIGATDFAVANYICPQQDGCIQQHSTITFVRDGFPSDIFTGRGPQGLAIADLTGKGSQDAITINGVGYSVSLNLGTIHQDTTLPGLGVTPWFALGDFNADGHPDLALAGDTGVYVLLGNGDGTFSSPTAYDQNMMTAAVVTGDFNGDGKLDLAVTNLLANTISVLMGNGDGTFQPPVNYSTGPLPEDAVAGDFNGDGAQDLAVVTNDVNISIFLGNGDGTFQPKVDYPAGLSIFSLATGDYNGDGILDFSVSDGLCVGSTCPANGSVNVLIGNGDGTFQSQLDFADGGQPTAITTGEFTYFEGQNGPVGRPGFATTNNTDNTISIFTPVVTGPVNPLPTISSISPTSAMVNSGAFTLMVNGTNFISGSTVYFNGQPRATTFVSPTQLTAAIQATDVEASGAVGVFVANPAPGGGDSTSAFFSVNLPAPTISSLSPSSVVAGGPAFTLMVDGSNFVNGAVVNFNGNPRTTTFVSSTQLTIAISASDIASQTTINISVTVPVGNGSVGGTTVSLPLSVLPTNTQPVVGGLSPASTTAGGQPFTLTLTGSGFTASSVVKFNSNVVSSAFVSTTELQASVPASAIAVGGTPFVTVANPGGNPSVVVTFTVNNPVPGASAVSPSSLPAGNAAVTINVTGTNFNASSAVLVNGTSRATTFVNTTSLNAAFLASDFAHSRTLNVTVNNPTPGGGTTSSLTLTVEDFQVSAPTSMSSVPAGQPANFSLMVTPANGTTANPVTFSVSGLPAGASASFLPSATIPAGSTTKTVTLTITTTPHSAASSIIAHPVWQSLWPGLPIPYWSFLLLTLTTSGIYLLACGKYRFVPQLTFVLILFIGAIGLVACGGTSPSVPLNPATGTPAGTYPIVVTAASGSGSLLTTVTLTVM